MADRRRERREEETVEEEVAEPDAEEKAEAVEEKTYKVVGTQPIFENPPGSEFKASLGADQEQFLKNIGAIEEV